MTTNMTRRDKKLLSGLGFFLVAAAILVLAILPLSSANADMKDQIELNEEKIAGMELKERELPAVRAAHEAQEEKLTGLQEQMLPMMKSQEIDRLLTEKVAAHGLSAMKLSITMPEEAANVPGYGREADDGSNPDKVDGVWLAGAVLDLTGNKAEMDALIDDLALSTPGVRITQVNFSSRERTDSGMVVREDLLSLSIELMMTRGA